MFIKEIKQKDEYVVFSEGACEFLARELYNKFNYSTVFIVDLINEPKGVSDERLLSMNKEEYLDYLHWFRYRMNYDNEYEDPYVCLIHCFGKVERGNKTYYIDRNGISDDMNDMLKHWEHYSIEKIEVNEYIRIIEMENPHDNLKSHWCTNIDAWCNKDELDDWNMEREELAKKFVEKHKDELDIDKVLAERKRNKEKETER